MTKGRIAELREALSLPSVKCLIVQSEMDDLLALLAAEESRLTAPAVTEEDEREELAFFNIALALARGNPLFVKNHYSEIVADRIRAIIAAPERKVSVSMEQIEDMFDAAIGTMGHRKGAEYVATWLKALGFEVTDGKE